MPTLEVVLEGTRSRDRRFLRPCTSFLHTLQGSRGDHEHTLLPISLHYERVTEQISFRAGACVGLEPLASNRVKDVEGGLTFSAAIDAEMIAPSGAKIIMVSVGGTLASSRLNLDLRIEMRL